MTTVTKPLHFLTAGDLMNREVVCLRDEMSLRDAAGLLRHNQIGGAPVVNIAGKCVGVLSAIDLLRLSETWAETARPAAALPVTCSYQARHTLDGKNVIRCLLPPGVCPIQVKREGPGAESVTVCSQPNCVLVDWQVVELEKLPRDAVLKFMTPDPVTVGTNVPIRVLARMMIDAHIHRIIVVDEEGKPVGVVSSTDLLAALARNDAADLAIS